MRKYIKINLKYPKYLEESGILNKKELRFLKKKKFLFYDSSTTIRDVFLGTKKQVRTL